MSIATIGIDLGKHSCSVGGLDRTGAVVLRRRLTRERLVAFLAGQPACVVAMEACCGAHHLGRLFAAQGHAVRLMSPEYVQPYVKAQKNDDRDAEAIAEAATRPTMRFVALKSAAQLDQQTLHRARSRLVNGRTRLMNQVRAILLERGITVAKGRRALGLALATLVDDTGAGLSARMRPARGGAPRMGRDRRPNRRARPGVRRDGAKLGAGAAAGDDPRHRRAQRHGADGGGRRGGRLLESARPRGLARPGAAADLHRRQGPARRHHQTWQRLSADAADPRRPGSVAGARPQRYAARRLVARTGRARPSERRRGGAGGKARPDRLGGVEERRRLRPARGGRLNP